MNTTPNWKHHSKKDRKGKGTCKGRLKARKQSLQHLKKKLGRSHKPTLSFA